MVALRVYNCFKSARKFINRGTKNFLVNFRPNLNQSFFFLHFATPQLPPIFPPYFTAMSLSGLTVRYLAGWGRVVQGYISSVQSVSLLPRSPSRMVSGLPVIVPRLSLSYMLLSGVSLTPRHVTSNPSLYFLICCLSYQPSLLPYHI